MSYLPDLFSKRSADVFFTSAALWWGFLKEPRTYKSGPCYLACDSIVLSSEVGPLFSKA